MNSESSFQNKSYKKHSEHFDDYSAGSKREAHASTWLEEDTVDAWRHQRMYKVLDPILSGDPSANWLTVGDGRYGKDARYILDSSCKALATDISDTLLKEAKDFGFINEYRQENAESLSFSNDEFDYVLCKESYHHFPRPMLALYEMLRVGRKGVVLIEPLDAYISEKIAVIAFGKFKFLVKRVLKLTSERHHYEDSGNYVYGISRREIEKVALGLNFKTVAFKGMNDMYFDSVEYEKLADNGPLQMKVRAKVRLANFLCKLKITDYELLAACVFKSIPSIEMIKKLKEQGFEVINLPDNPYISS